jgi:hypothetical protein
MAKRQQPKVFSAVSSSTTKNSYCELAAAELVTRYA